MAVTSTNNLRYGSSGDDVIELQKKLNENGYTLDVDGKFGPKTQEAVRDYQQKNGLAVDGIVGTNTWGALTKATAPAETTPAPTTPTTPTTPEPEPWSYDAFKQSDSTAAADKKRQETAASKPGEFSYGEYQKSDAVRQAEAMLQEQRANKPGAYQSAWQTQLDDILHKILNREDFSYDLNGDALYQQYKDQYMLQGQQAMMNTMGQAQAMTGGYGNSYAQTVGQQTYQGYLQQLNDRVPELYKLALDKYNQEGQDLYNQYGLYADLESQDYSRYRDSVTDHYAEEDRLRDEARYQSEQDYGRWATDRDFSYGQHRDSVTDWHNEQARADEDYWRQYERDYGQWGDGRDLSYQQYRDQVSDDQWKTAFEYQQERDNKTDEQWQAQFDEAVRQFNHTNGVKSGGSSSGGSSGGSSSSSSSSSGGGLTYSEEAAKKQRELVAAGYDIEVDGKWGPASKAAWEKYQASKKDGGGGSFTGSTYSEACAYLKSKGKSSSGLMTQSEWARHKNKNNSAGGEHEASSYKEYLAAYIYGQLN